jgi:hypothetical protein
LRQPGWIAAILITLLIVGFHFYFLLHVGGFWRDEVNLINVAGRHSRHQSAHRQEHGTVHGRRLEKFPPDGI